MSHYVVAVVHRKNQSVENLLAPFDESLEVEFDGHWAYNPNAKWDWYTFGGRWEGFLRLKNGERVNEARISEIDFDPDPEQYRKSLRLWEVVVDDSPLREDENKEDFEWFYSKAYYTSHFNNAKEYALYTSTPAPYSILTPDGEWLEAGLMGWWGMSCADEDAAKEWHKNAPYMLQKFDNSLYVTIVDCHI